MSYCLLCIFVSNAHYVRCTFDDSSVQESTAKAAVNEQAYVLIYQKRKQVKLQFECVEMCCAIVQNYDIVALICWACTLTAL